MRESIFPYTLPFSLASTIDRFACSRQNHWLQLLWEYADESRTETLSKDFFTEGHIAANAVACPPPAFLFALPFSLVQVVCYWLVENSLLFHINTKQTLIWVLLVEDMFLFPLGLFTFLFCSKVDYYTMYHPF